MHFDRAIPSVTKNVPRNLQGEGAERHLLGVTGLFTSLNVEALCCLNRYPPSGFNAVAVVNHSHTVTVTCCNRCGAENETYRPAFGPPRSQSPYGGALRRFRSATRRYGGLATLGEARNARTIAEVGNLAAARLLRAAIYVGASDGRRRRARCVGILARSRKGAAGHLAARIRRHELERGATGDPICLAADQGLFET